ncbi:ATP-grasp domain-containing protein, partial [Acidobacteria bacterium AH-259-L09]|nr:ATP-grasp domain-containing protein [Acidobacteria bacterium AH-259-L09]
VLGNDSRSFLAVIRSLGRQNLTVHVAWDGHESIARHSRYIAKIHPIPPYSGGETNWKQALLSIIREEQFDLAIPCHDENLLPFQAHRKDFEKLVRMGLVNDRAFEVVFDKANTYELAKSLGIPLPRAFTVLTLSEIDAILSRFELPVVLKPCTSYRLENLNVKNHVCKVYTLEELTTYLESLLHQGKVLVQENFPGTGVGVEVLVDQGEILVAFQHVRIHEPITGGGSSYRKSVSVEPELLKAVKTLLRSLEYTGVAMVEFRVNFDTGEWILVEINGRFWGSLPLALAAGADFPYYLYQLLVEGKREFPQGYKAGIYSRNLFDDFGWMVQNLGANRTDKTSGTLPLWEVTKELINLVAFRERSDTLVMDDPKPGFVEICRLLSACKSLALDKIKNLCLLLQPVRRFYGRRTRRALIKAQTVLFVCKGNICRSPFAEAYARVNLGESVQVTSCGYYPEGNRVCPTQAVKTAKKLGIDLAAHRSSVITEDNVRRAEIIFTFDSESRRTVISRYPFAKGKVYRLGLLAPKGPISIEDPFGKSSTEFYAVYQNIVRILNNLKCAESSA